MNRREVAALAVRLVGIYCIVQGLPYIQVAATMLGEARLLDREHASPVLMGLVPLLTLVAVGGVLLVYAAAIATRIVRDTSDQPAPEPWTSQQVLAIAFAVVGVYLVATSLAKLPIQGVQAVQLYQMLYDQGPNAPMARTMTHQAATMLSTILTAALGVCLFVGGRGLSNLWHRLRSAGKPVAGEGA